VSVRFASLRSHGAAPESFDSSGNERQGPWYPISRETQAIYGAHPWPSASKNPHVKELATRGSDGKLPRKLSFGWQSDALRARACSRETNLNPEPVLPPISVSPASKAVDAATVRPSQESPYLRIFKSTVFVRNHDRSLQFTWASWDSVSLPIAALNLADVGWPLLLRTGVRFSPLLLL
jgi:hypothetical protein